MGTAGYDGKMYYGDALLDGDTKTPSTVIWTEIDAVKDFELSIEHEEYDRTTRADGGNRSTVATLQDASVDVELEMETDDATYIELRDAWAGRAQLSLAFMDGDIAAAGSEGYAGNFSILSMSRAESLAEHMRVTFTARLYGEGEWYTVTGS